MSSLSFSVEKCEAFFDAAYTGDLPLVKSLSRDPEVNPNWQDIRGDSPFHFACSYGHVDVVRYLLDFHDNRRGVIDCNLTDFKGNSPFISTCYQNHVKVIKMLLDEERIDVTKSNSSGRTALYWTSHWGQVGFAKMILASTSLIDTLKVNQENGRTAAGVARERGAQMEKDYPSEPEDAFQERKKGCQLIVPLIEAYQKDPEAVRARLRRELGIDERKAGELFALVVFYSDGYLKISEVQGEGNAQRRKDAQRFFNLASSLPLDLQMVLCNRAFGLGDSIVKRIYSELGFIKFSRE